MRILFQTKVRAIILLTYRPTQHTGIFNDFLADRRLSADYHSRLFWSTAFADPLETSHFINTPHPIDPYIPHHLYPPLLYQAQTGEIPVAVHFNGPVNKELIRAWWGKFWWNQLKQEGDGRFRETVMSRLQGATVRFGGLKGVRKEWRDLCPNSTLAL
jgi:hypothetical protein